MVNPNFDAFRLTDDELIHWTNVPVPWRWLDVPQLMGAHSTASFTALSLPRGHVRVVEERDGWWTASAWTTKAGAIALTASTDQAVVVQTAQQFAVDEGAGAFYVSTAWRWAPASPKQRAVCESVGIPLSTTATREEAMDKLTARQAWRSQLLEAVRIGTLDSLIECRSDRKRAG
jgi:hypothetical protein